MNKHTKGPWKVTNQGGGTGVSTGDNYITGAGTNANATLIASAPDLLECLIELAHYSGFANDAENCECGTFYEMKECEHTKAWKAIAKAKGEK